MTRHRQAPWAIRRGAVNPLRSVVLLAGAIPLAGCFPPVVHPTRVEPGPAISASTWAQVAEVIEVDDDAHVRALPNFSIRLAAGFADTLRDGVNTLVSFGAGLNGVSADGYLEIPRSALGDLDAGLGMVWQNGPLGVVMPYVQVGRLLNAHSAWFTSQGLAIVSSQDSDETTPVWMSTVGFSRSGAGRTGIVFVSAIIGRSFGYECRSCFSRLLIRRSYVLVGVSGDLPMRFPGR